MRILHLIAPSPFGGAERVVRDLAGELAGAGHETHVGAILDEGATEHPFLADPPAGVRLHPIRVAHRAYRTEWKRVARLIKDVIPDVVHTHGYRADVLSGAAAARVGAPVVSTAHGFTGGGVRNRLYEWLQVRAQARADAVIAVSEIMHGELRKRGIPAARIRTIVNARRLPENILDRESARRELGVSDGAFHVGWVGRMSPEKGPDVMVDAVTAVASDPPAERPLRVTLVGEGRLRAGLEARIRAADLESTVRFTGALPDAVRYFRAFDVLALTSRTEGTPLVALEAAGLSIPLVATRVGGLPALLGSRGGLLVPSESPDAVADALRAVRDDPEAARERARTASMGLRGTDALRCWAASHIELYRKVVRT